MYCIMLQSSAGSSEGVAGCRGGENAAAEGGSRNAGKGMELYVLGNLLYHCLVCIATICSFIAVCLSVLYAFL